MAQKVPFSCLAFPDHSRDPLNGHVANHGGSVVRHRELKIALLLRQRVMAPNRKVETIPGQTALTSDEEKSRGSRCLHVPGASIPLQPRCLLPLLPAGLRRKQPCLSHLYIKTIILPRQARDKHRESTQKKIPFFAPGCPPRQSGIPAPAFLVTNAGL